MFYGTKIEKLRNNQTRSPQKSQSAREDGQLLILPSDFSEEVGALSDPTHGSSSAAKVGESPELTKEAKEKGAAIVKAAKEERAKYKTYAGYEKAAEKEPSVQGDDPMEILAAIEAAKEKQAAAIAKAEEELAAEQERRKTEEANIAVMEKAYKDAVGTFTAEDMDLLGRWTEHANLRTEAQRRAAEQTKGLDDITNTDTNSIIGVTLKDGTKAYVVGGDIEQAEDGTTTNRKKTADGGEDKSIVIADEKGERRQVSTDEIQTIGSTLDPKTERSKAVADILTDVKAERRVSRTVKAGNKATLTVTENVTDEQGNITLMPKEIEATVTAVDGDGNVAISTIEPLTLTGGSLAVTEGGAQEMTLKARDFLAARKDETLQQRYTPKRRKKGAASYKVNDSVRLQAGDDRVRVTVMNADKDNVKIRTENGELIALNPDGTLAITPVGGQQVMTMPRETFENILRSTPQESLLADMLTAEEVKARKYTPGEIILIKVDGEPMEARVVSVGDDGNVLFTTRYKVRLPGEVAERSDHTLSTGDLAMREMRAKQPAAADNVTTEANAAPQDGENAPANPKTPLSPLSQIPPGADGKPDFEKAETPELAYDAMVEAAKGNADNAAATIKVLLDNAKAKVKAAAKKVADLKKAAEKEPSVQGDDPMEILAAIEAAKEKQAAAIKKAEEELAAAQKSAAFWKNVAETPKRRAEEAANKPADTNTPVTTETNTTPQDGENAPANPETPPATEPANTNTNAPETPQQGVAAKPTLMDAVRTLYEKGKDVASKLFGRKYFDVAETPDFMKALGLTGDKFTIRYGTISRHAEKDTDHSLPVEIWEQLPEALQHPFAITKYYEKSEANKEEKNKIPTYRIYTALKLNDGYVMVAAKVKNAGKNIEVNSITTIFGKDKISPTEKELYRDPKITPEQASLLDGINPHQYPSAQESDASSGAKVGESPELTKEAKEKGAAIVQAAKDERAKYKTYAGYEKAKHKELAAYESGEKNGECAIVSPTGQTSVMRFENGVKREQRDYDENGNMLYEVQKDENGLTDGVERFLYTNGRISNEISYKHGVKDGVQRAWHPNGRVSLERTFKDGEEVGTTRRWDEDGNLTWEYRYYDGEDGRRHLTAKEWEKGDDGKMTLTRNDELVAVKNRYGEDDWEIVAKDEGEAKDDAPHSFSTSEKGVRSGERRTDTKEYKDFLKKLKKAAEKELGKHVVVFGTEDELVNGLDEGTAARIKRLWDKGREVYGWHTGDKVYIYAPDIFYGKYGSGAGGDAAKALRNALGTQWHEGRVHYGLRARLGEGGFRKYCHRVYSGMTLEAKNEYLAYHWDNNMTASRKREILNEAKEYGYDLDAAVIGKDWDELTAEEQRGVLCVAAEEMLTGAADEYSGHLADKIRRGEALDDKEQTLWEKIKKWIKSLLGDDERSPFASREALTDKEIADIILGMGGWLKERTRQEAKVEKGKDGGTEFSVGKKRKLSADEAERVVSAMEREPERARVLEFSKENWEKEFGKDNRVNTPLGVVKLGENQYTKLEGRGRKEYFGMMKPTLTRPDVIMEEYDPREGAERDTVYLFVKTFEKPDGSRLIHFESATVQKEGMEISISSHEIDRDDIIEKMQHENVLHLNENLSPGSEWPLTGTPEGERPDLVPTSDKSVPGAKVGKADETAREEDKNFSVGKKNEPVEVIRTKSGKSLVGIHNITATNLRKALRLGGLANPSAAVVDLNKGSHTYYGEISLLLPSSMVDARTGKNAGTFYGDAWTPMVPPIEKLSTGKGVINPYKDFEKLPEEMRTFTGNHFYSWLQNGDTSGLYYMFLFERGEAPEFDKYDVTTNDDARKYIEEHHLQGEFEDWAAGLNERYGYKDVIFNGYTPSGTPRHINADLDSISKYMKKQGRAGGGAATNYGGAAVWIAKILSKGRSLDDIRTNRDRLRGNTEDTHKKVVEIRNNLFDEVTRISETIGKDGTVYKGREAWGIDGAIAEALLHPDPKAYLKATFGEEISDRDNNKLKALVKEIRENYPATYFETKFERPVKLNEFAAAVVPEDTDEKLVQGLTDAGLRVSTYTDEADRRQKIEEAADDDVRFSVGKKKGVPRPIGAGENGDIYDWTGRDPIDAFRFLINRRTGDVRNVFYRSGIGSIDLIWGDDRGGLCHIVNKHIGERGEYKDIDDMIRHIADVVNKGDIVENKGDTCVISLNGHRVVIRKDYNGKKKNWVVSSYDSNTSVKKKGAATNPFSSPHGAEAAGSYAVRSSGAKVGKAAETAREEDKNFSVGRKKEDDGNHAEPNPSEAQKKAGNYKLRHVKVDGFDVSIENEKGSVRRGTDADGTAWETEMHHDYGYIRGTRGVDGDHIDVFLSDNPEKGDVYVVDQINPKTGEFDEHKVMYGFGSEEEARNAYLSNYDDGWQGLGNITRVSKDEFRKWIDSSVRKTKPFTEYKAVREKRREEAGAVLSGVKGQKQAGVSYAESGQTRFSVGERDPFAADLEARRRETDTARKAIDDILERAKKDYTVGKAPNGKPSNLMKHGERLWAAVRTPQFKAWFGDWEKAARMNHIKAIKPTVVKEHSITDKKELRNKWGEIGSVKNDVDGRVVNFPKSVFDKCCINVKGLFGQSMFGLADAFKKSVLAYSDPDSYAGLLKKNGIATHKAHPEILSYYNYIGKINLRGKDYYVRYTVTENKTRSQLHSSFVSNVEIYEGGYEGNRNNFKDANQHNHNTERGTLDEVVDAKLRKFFEDAEDAQENMSKAVDENGEPKVFYHNTPGKFTVFDEKRNGTHNDAGWLGDGFYFYGVEHEGDDYGKNKMAVFLDMREPYYATSEDNNRLAEANDRAASVAFREDLENDGYDGVYYDGDMRQEAVVFNPNQIKSVENNGEFSAENDDIRFSVGKKRRSEMEARLEKNRPDLKEEEKKALFDYLDTLDDRKVENATFTWFMNGTIRIPEDMDKVRQAVDVSGKAKVDPSRYRSPMELISAHTQFEPTEKAINPDDVPTLKNKKTLEGGITVYNVDESEESRKNMRQIINTHMGKNASPWCLLQGDDEGNLTEESKDYWNDYGRYPKRVAFQNGKLIAFFASKDEPTWWSKLDRPTKGIPIHHKVPGDELGRIGTYEYDEATGELSDKPSEMFKGGKQNGTYEEWNADGILTERSHWKDGKMNGTYEKWNAEGQRIVRAGLKDNKLNGVYEQWDDYGELQKRAEYKDDKLNGKSETLGEWGQKIVEHYKDGVLDGEREEYFGEGWDSEEVAVREHYKDGELDGVREEWDFGGNLKERSHWKDGKENGLFEKWDDGLLESREYYEDGERVELDMDDTVADILSRDGIIGTDNDGNVIETYRKNKKAIDALAREYDEMEVPETVWEPFIPDMFTPEDKQRYDAAYDDLRELSRDGISKEEYRRRQKEITDRIEDIKKPYYDTPEYKEGMKRREAYLSAKEEYDDRRKEIREKIRSYFDDTPRETGTQFSVGKKKGSTEEAAEIVKRKRAIDAIVPTEVQSNNMSRAELQKVFSGIGKVRNANDGKEVDFYMSGFHKNYRKDGLFAQAVPGLKETFENSILAYNEGEKYAGKQRRDGTVHKPHDNIEGYSNYIGRINIDGSPYYARFSVTEEKNAGSGLHSTFVSNVDLYKKATTSSKPSLPLFVSERAESSKVVDANLQKFFERANEIEKNGTENAQNGTVNFSVGRKAADKAKDLGARYGAEIKAGDGELTAAEKKSRAAVTGVYDARTGRATIHIKDGATKRDVERTVLTTAVANKGLAASFGKERYRQFLDDVYEAAGDDVRREIAHIAYGMGGDFASATARWLAARAEDGIDSSDPMWREVKRLCSYVKNSSHKKTILRIP